MELELKPRRMVLELFVLVVLEKDGLIYYKNLGDLFGGKMNENEQLYWELKIAMCLMLNMGLTVLNTVCILMLAGIL